MTAIETANAHFLFVHLEAKLIDTSRTERPDIIRSSVSVLVRAAAALDAPVLHVVTHGGMETLILELQPLVEPGACLTAHAASAFANSEVATHLERSRRRTLILGGYAAEVALLHTALDAIASGYQVIVPIEATGSGSERAERAAIDQIARAGGRVMATASLLAAFAPDFSTKRGKVMLSLIEDLQAAIGR